MIKLFLISLWLTFLIIRTLTHKLDIPKIEIGRTPTSKIRVRTGWNIHHIHFGFIILIINLITILIYDINNFNIIFLAIGLSLIADQIVPLFYKKICYFGKQGIFWAILLHLIITLIIILILSRINSF